MVTYNFRVENFWLVASGDGINFASKISGHVLVFQLVMLLCWSTFCNLDPWLDFLYTVPPHPLISMLWRALFIHLRNLFREKADAAQSIKEQNNIEIGGRGEHEERLHRDKHCTTQKKSKLRFRFTCEINSVTSSILDGCSPTNMQVSLHVDISLSGESGDVL